MNMKQAKLAIIAEMNTLLNMNFATTLEVEQHLVMQVKLGKITALEAAKISNDTYEEKCTRAFEKKEAKEALSDI